MAITLEQLSILTDDAANDGLVKVRYGDTVLYVTAVQIHEGDAILLVDGAGEEDEEIEEGQE